MPAYQESFAAKNGDHFEIRSLRPEDAPAFCAFLDRVARETFYTNELVSQPKDPAKTAQGLRQLAGQREIFWVGAFLGTEMAAFLGSKGVAADGHPFFRHIYTFDLMVCEKFWGLGLGGRLMEIMHDQARRRGIKRIEALVKEGNERALALYRKHGYEIEGTRRKSVLVDGRYLDEYFVGKLFF